MLAHIVYFTLHDGSDSKRKELVDACHKYLKTHPGVVFFAAGTLNPDLKRPVNQVDFDVALHVVFDTMESQNAYQVADLHLKFIAEQKENWKQVKVYDADVT
jgi:hypothetical protein